ncbi:MAG: stage II sporulation protein P [Oscillospiraceae bacterium]|nr:stage II sporulation protein P [Oscillospiraceae bacterium]
MLSSAKQKLDGLGYFFENNENISQNSGNTNSVTGGRLTLLGDDSGILSKGVRRMPSSSDEEGDVPDSPLPAASGNASPLPYTSCGDEAGGDILRQSYPAYTGENYINLPLAGQLRNVTALSAEEILAECNTAPDFWVEPNSPLPQVLIMHTHTTETYERSERLNYDSDFLARTTDSDMNMTAVGRAMARVLNDNGINTLHDETVHDYPSYNGSYDRSRETVAKILRENPSVKVVLDVHRDAIERADGTRVAPFVEINGKNAAQIMIICGCDDGTMDMPNCMKNLRTASLFEQYIESNSPGLTRPVLFDYRKYNQDMTTGSLLIEVGGHANSIDEAVYAGELAAKGIADALIQNALTANAG